MNQNTITLQNKIEQLGYIVKVYETNHSYDYAIFKNIEKSLEPVCNIIKNRNTNVYEIFMHGFISDIEFLELITKFMKSLMSI